MANAQPYCSLYDPTYQSDDYHPVVTFHYYRQWDNFRMSSHAHAAIEIMYVISGHCTIHTQNMEIRLSKNDFILLDGGVQHRLVLDDNVPCRMMNLEFVLDACQRPAPSLRALADADRSVDALLSSNNPVWVLKDSGEIYHTLKSLVLELDGVNGQPTVMQDVLLAQLFIQIARQADRSQDTQGDQTDAYVQHAMAYIHHHYDCDILVQDVAAAVNLHPGYLHRIFKRSTGCSVNEYLTRLRIEKAKQLLSRTDIPVTEISSRIGINSSQYFSTLFKKHTGCAPQSYRKSYEISSDRKLGF